MRGDATRGPHARRRTIALLALGLLVILDVARSVSTRLVSAHPYTLWVPSRDEFTSIAWPPERAVPANASLGQRVFIEHCAICHGQDGHGNGPAAPSFSPRPRDFAAGTFEYKSTPMAQAPTDSDLIRVVKNGLIASGMPYWRDVLTDSEVVAVVDYVKTFAHLRAGSPIAVPPIIRSDSASIARGARVYHAQGCDACHGEDGQKRTSLLDSKGQRVVARDLAAPWTFRGGSAPRDVWLRLTTGLAPSPMPSFANTTTANERWDLVNYVASLARKPPWEGGTFAGPGFQADLEKRGDYLMHAEVCQLCHTQIDPTGIYRDSYALSGGMRVGAYPHGVFVTGNLTSDSLTGLGARTAEGIARTIRTGHLPARQLDPLAMPWPFFHDLSDSDALAIGSYLKTLPPRYHQRAPPLHYGVIETVAVKLLRGPPASVPRVLTYTEGDFARDTPGPVQDVTQRILAGAQWSVLIVALLAILIVGPRPSWWASALFALGAAIVWFLYATPAISFIPPEQIARQFNAAVPPPPRGNQMAARGYYLFKVASCQFCHQPNGRGGWKLSGHFMFGTLWTRNITSDSATGIGAWSDAEIMRAIRSGVARGGRPLHWQAMPWDIWSNWDEEDIRALVAYLRTLPPVTNRIPSPRAPSPDDCPVYTFWLATDTIAGCK